LPSAMCLEGCLLSTGMLLTAYLEVICETPSAAFGIV
jgi:hypothetical protein